MSEITFTKEQLRELDRVGSFSSDPVKAFLPSFALALLERLEAIDEERGRAMAAVAFADENFANARTAWKNDTLAATEKIIGNRELRAWANLPAVRLSRALSECEP